MYNFRKISARSEEFIFVRNRFNAILSDFVSFLEVETENNPASKKGVSGKAESYKNYLVRLYIIVYETKDIDLEINSIEFLEILNSITHTPNFKEYNLKEGRFPNATVKSYNKFLQTL